MVDTMNTMNMVCDTITDISSGGSGNAGGGNKKKIPEVNELGETVCERRVGMGIIGQTVGREQDTVRRDGGRWEQKPRTGKIGNSRSGTKNHMVSRFRTVPFPSRPHLPVPTLTARNPDEKQ